MRLNKSGQPWVRFQKVLNVKYVFIVQCLSIAIKFFTFHLLYIRVQAKTVNQNTFAFPIIHTYFKRYREIFDINFREFCELADFGFCARIDFCVNSEKMNY